ncbi:MAG: hypothetical protein RLZZ511_2064 [Cyanobacteriota bacterium]|jgi:DNA-binding NarL/FixJ family response regulator
MTFDRAANLSLALVEPDSLFRMGLERYLRQYTDWQVVVETGDDRAIAGLLEAQQAISGLPDVLIIGLPGADALSAPPLLRSLKQQFPFLRILLLATLDDPAIADAWWLGIEGCCWRSGGETELLEAIWRVAGGETYWSPAMRQAALGNAALVSLRPPRPDRSPPWMQIDRALQAIDAKLRQPQTPAITRWVLQGRRRELLAARGLTRLLLPGMPAQPVRTLPDTPPIAQIQPAAPVNGIALSSLFDRLAAKLQYPLDNRTEIPLEIDILRSDKQRELLYLVLRQLEKAIDEVRFSQVPLERLGTAPRQVLVDLWSAVLPEFFGKYYQLVVRGAERPVVATLRQQQERVERDILSQIPLVPELLGYVLFQQPLVVDNQAFPASSPVAIAQAEAILTNLVIQVANAVMQPLLNEFADVEAIKQGFYDRRWLSSREIERFRNDLSWRYRHDRWVGEPTAIFESQYYLWVMTELGLAQQAIYAPRRQELEGLSGVPWLVTFGLELRDALTPRLRSATAWVGSGLVYVLTEVVGRGLGLVGRGIIKGIGNALQERR